MIGVAKPYGEIHVSMWHGFTFLCSTHGRYRGRIDCPECVKAKREAELHSALPIDDADSAKGER